jgi:hypothetical protein
VIIRGKAARVDDEENNMWKKGKKKRMKVKSDQTIKNHARSPAGNE